MQVCASSRDYLKQNSKVAIASYDIARCMANEAANVKFKIIIADESHYLKNPKSKRSKAIIPLLQRTRRAICLTGTPILQRPAEMFGQLSGLRPDIFQNFYPYAERYCDP